MKNLSRKAFEVKENWKISIDVVFPYKISTFVFSNTGHKDNDYMTVEDSKLVQQYVDESLDNISRITCLVSKMYFLNTS